MKEQKKERISMKGKLQRMLKKQMARDESREFSTAKLKFTADKDRKM